MSNNNHHSMDLKEELSKYRQVRALDKVLTAVDDLTHSQKESVFAAARFKSNTNEHAPHHSSHTTKDESKTDYASNVALHGVIACLSRYGTEDKKMLGAMITSLGGKVEPELSVVNRITHLIIPQDEIHYSQKFLFVQEKANSGGNDSSITAKWASQIKVVTHEWVFACLTAKQHVNEYQFCVTSNPPPSLPSIQDDNISSSSSTNQFTANQQSTKASGIRKEGWDPSSVPMDGQRAGHPLLNYQPKSVKDANRGVADGAYFIETSVQVVISTCPLHSDMVICHRKLDEVPHGSAFVKDKHSSDETLRSSGVTIIDVPLEQKTFSIEREDDGITVYRSGTSQAGRVSMSLEAKKHFVAFLTDDRQNRYRSKDSGRDVGNEVYRYDLLFNQAQPNSYVYADADGFVVRSKGDPLRVPHLRKQTDMIHSLPEDIKVEFTQVVTGMDELAQELYPGAFGDERRRRLVHNHFVKNYFGDQISINWEYIGIVARRITKDDHLAMHIDAKNDGRRGYDICSTYSYVIDGYRVTIIAACKQDFGSLMESLDKVEVAGGHFLPPDEVRWNRV